MTGLICSIQPAYYQPQIPTLSVSIATEIPVKIRCQIQNQRDGEAEIDG
jgi:hypothetical protein